MSPKMSTRQELGEEVQDVLVGRGFAPDQIETDSAGQLRVTIDTNESIQALLKAQEKLPYRVNHSPDSEANLLVLNPNPWVAEILESVETFDDDQGENGLSAVLSFPYEDPFSLRNLRLTLSGTAVNPKEDDVLSMDADEIHGDWNLDGVYAQSTYHEVVLTPGTSMTGTPVPPSVYVVAPITNGVMHDVEAFNEKIAANNYAERFREAENPELSVNVFNLGIEAPA